MAWTSPRTWSTGELVTAAIMNTHIKDNLSDIAFNGHMAKARAQDLAGNGIATTETVELTATLSIPASWAGYDIEAEFSGSVRESGTLTAARNVNGRIRLTNATGTVLGSNTVLLDSAIAPQRLAMPVLGYITGQTATGSVAIVFTSELSGDSGQADWANGTLIATAYRTS